MAEIGQYSFTWDEVAALLINKAGITEGLWTVGVSFNLGAVTVGPDKDHIRPAILASIENLVLQKATEPGPLTFDAATLTSNQ
jgi:hypothetical protein